VARLLRHANAEHAQILTEMQRTGVVNLLPVDGIVRPKGA
jgi:hypothetical protein